MNSQVFCRVNRCLKFFQIEITTTDRSCPNAKRGLHLLIPDFQRSIDLPVTGQRIFHRRGDGPEIEIVPDDFKLGRTAAEIVGFFRQLNCSVNLQSRSGACQLDRFRRGHSIVSGNVCCCSIESRARDL